MTLKTDGKTIYLPKTRPMNRFTHMMLAIWMSIAGVACAAEANTTNSLPFHVGEKLTYSIYWGPFMVGRATLEVKEPESVDGHECYRLVAEARTSGLAESLYSVRSKAESWLDTDELISRRYRQDRVEGSHKRLDDTVFDYTKQMAVTTNLLSGQIKKAPLQGAVHDVISAIYRIRTEPLRLDQEQTVLVNAKQENFNVTFRPDERKDIVVKPLGKVSALRIEPNPTIKFVSANGGRMWVWFSEDDRHLPIMLVSQMKIGNARLVLTDYQNGGPKPDRAGPTTNFTHGSGSAPGR